MSRWIKSTTQKQWTINGKVVPKCITKNNDYLCVSDSEYNQMIAKPVFNSLVKSGGVLVLTKEPAELKNNVEGLTASNAELMSQLTQLKEENEALKKDSSEAKIAKAVEKAVASFKEEAIKELQEKQEALEAAQAEVKELKSKLKKASKSE